MELLANGPITYSDIDDHLSSCVVSVKRNQQIFETLNVGSKIDSFEAKHLSLTIATTKDRIERMYAAFDHNYSTRKDTVFTKCSIPVLQMYVATRKSEEVTKIVNRFIK